MQSLWHSATSVSVSFYEAHLVDSVGCVLLMFLTPLAPKFSIFMYINQNILEAKADSAVGLFTVWWGTE